ncbi:protein translocase subunit secE/sec61 gamma [Friedmanniella luteola]|uniref:Protein translocase subunit SecE n=1 Tax=Friedmanniella luteola TaxID=546871 RepID=A0A1H1Z4D1_9ACTN|nr:preprotein translocase subunit SecE [Friedmanniella luteola]SDT28594.1 protein translocase subunit secE/sec61 gamma [Friedmanniella luteola]
MADKDEEGTAGEPTSDDLSAPLTGSSGSHALRADAADGDADREVEEGREPTGAELAASGYDTAGRSDVADLDHSGSGSAHDEKVDDDDVDAHVDQLEPVAAGAVGRDVVPARDRRPAPRSKGVATPSRNRPEKVRRTGPRGFVKESVGELRKVVYPTGQQLLNYFVVVLVFVLFVIAYVSLLDLGLGWAIFRVFA